MAARLVMTPRTLRASLDGLGDDDEDAGEAGAGPALPEGWEEHLVEGSPHVYYYNTATGATQWDFPEEAAHVMLEVAHSDTSGATLSVEHAGGEGEAAAENDGDPAVTAADPVVVDAAAGGRGHPNNPPRAAPPGSPPPTLSKKELKKRQDKDYVALARDYARMQPYRKLDTEPLCCMCHVKPVKDVLFPCEHKCVCRACLETNDIGESRRRGKWALCPLCCGEIKRVLPSNGGKEVEAYWDWVLEVKPRLDSEFPKRFEFAAAYLRQPPDDPAHVPTRLHIPMPGAPLRKTKKKKTRHRKESPEAAPSKACVIS